jgi:hypothetical protein
MNTLPNSNIIRQKAIVENVFELPLKTVLFSPRQDSSENFYVCSQAGEIIKFNDKGEYSVSLSLSGQPSSLIFTTRETNSNQMDSVNNSNEKEENFIEELYYTDIANSVIYRSTNDEAIPFCVKEYQGNPFKGPKALTVNNEDNSILLCDSGYFESISLNNPLGSIFIMDLETNEIAPLLLNCL